VIGGQAFLETIAPRFGLSQHKERPPRSDHRQRDCKRGSERPRWITIWRSYKMAWIDCSLAPGEILELGKSAQKRRRLRDGSRAVGGTASRWLQSDSQGFSERASVIQALALSPDRTGSIFASRFSRFATISM
jgi:hypothetical protein